MNPETQNTEAVLARVTERAKQLAEINAELLDTLEAIAYGRDHLQVNDYKNLARTAIAKAEGSE